MAQNEQGGSDLDIFEDLGKKGAPSRTLAGSKTVPPPPAQSSARPTPVIDPKQTLLGIRVPAAPSSAPSGTLQTAAVRTPPPPPGRGSLPPVVAVPTRPSASLPAAAPYASAAQTGAAQTDAAQTAHGQPAPAPGVGAGVGTGVGAGVGAGVDINWDADEDEATHIFDDRDELPKPPADSASGPVNPKATLLGLPPPGTLTSGVRPSASVPQTPGVGQLLGYPASAGAYPPPHGAAFPAPPVTQPGLGLGFPPGRSSLPAPPSRSVPPAASVPLATPFPRPAPSPDYLLAQAQGLEQTALVHPRQRRTALYAVVGLAAFLVLGAAWIFLGAPKTGRIVVNVVDGKGQPVNRVEIFVDGKKHCDAPCLVDGVAAGAHDVKVLAEGFDDPSMQTVSVEGQKDVVSTFTLGAPKGTGLKVSGTQPGVKLYVDDKEIGPLPQDVHDLAPGDHAIRVAGSERYQPIQRRVAIEKDQVYEIGSVTLKVLKGKATIDPGTPGARVYLVSGADRRELPMLPISVDIDTAKTWSLEASKAGFEEYKQAISFDDGQAEKTFVVTLAPKASAPVEAPVAANQPAPAAPPAFPAVPSPGPSPTPSPAPSPIASSAPAAAAGTASASSEPASDDGEAFLNINSIPPSTCFLDGRSLGSTPRVHVSVKPGTHMVRFINADQGLTKTVTVSVGSGETKPAVAKLN